MKNKNNIYIIVGVIAVLAIIGGAVYFSQGSNLKGDITYVIQNNREQFANSRVILNVSISSSPSSQLLKSGAPSAPLVGLNFSNGGGSDITVTSLSLQGYVDGNTAGVFGTNMSTDDGGSNLKDIIDSLGLYQNSTLVSPYSSLGAAGKVTFSNMNLVVPSRQSVMVTLQGSISNSAPFGRISDRVKFALVSASDVVAKDNSGNTLVPGIINVSSALNGGAADSGTIMTIIK